MASHLPSLTALSPFRAGVVTGGQPGSDEKVWLAAARCGEPWALEQLYCCYQASIYTLCHRLLGRVEDAEDAMQAAFVRAFRELPRFRGDSAVRTWLYRIAVNEALGILRRRREVPASVDEGPGGSEAGGESTPTMVERLAVRAALAQVKPDHRVVLVLRFWEGLSYEEIASVLGISLPATKMRLLRAREEFRRCYQDAA